MNTVLFDLDGTLLPMDLDLFVEAYLKELSLKGASIGYEPRRLVQIVMEGAEIMAANDGSMTNEERFWQLFLGAFGGVAEDHSAEFDRFYQNEFSRVSSVVNPTPLANRAVQLLKEKGYQIVLATDPIFPRAATLERMRWAGVDPADFSLITTYEDFHYAKPNLDYYRQILDIMGLRPENCLMVGNDVQQDLCAAALGMNVYLVTDNIINVTGDDFSEYTHGDRRALLTYLSQLPTLV